MKKSINLKVVILMIITIILNILFFLFHYEIYSPYCNSNNTLFYIVLLILIIFNIISLVYVSNNTNTNKFDFVKFFMILSFCFALGSLFTLFRTSCIRDTTCSSQSFNCKCEDGKDTCDCQYLDQDNNIQNITCPK